MLKIHDLPWAGRGMGPGLIGDADGPGADGDDATEPSTILFSDDLFEDCEPFRGDALGWSPRWTGGRGLNEFTGQAIRLEVQLNNARIYAIRGLFTAMANRETRTFVRTGEAPKRRLGFG